MMGRKSLSGGILSCRILAREEVPKLVEMMNSCEDHQMSSEY